MSLPRCSVCYTADSATKHLDLDADAILEEMKSGDYENLIDVFNKNFGDYVTLYR